MFKKLAVFLALAGFAACASVNPDTYKSIGHQYNRDDGWFMDSSNNFHLIANGSTVGNFNAAGTTLTLANGGTIANDTNNEIQLAEGSEDISFGFGTANEATVTTDTGVTRVDFEAIGVRTTTPLFMVDMIRFCATGANGATTSYMGPVLLDDTEADLAFGGAGCDALDSTTEATADAPWHAAWDYKVIGMSCVVDDGGTDDTYTFQMRDDTADVTGVTCSVTLDGSGFNTCTVVLDAPVAVAAGSAIAVSSAGTDDDCSACDQECKAFITY